MSKPLIVMVARDAAPSGCFRRLVPVLVDRGFDTCLMIGDGRPLGQSNEEIVSAVFDASLVLLGMSSSAELAEPEIIAGTAAASNKVPFGFYGDVPRCWARARPGVWFGSLAAKASFYFGVNDSDAKASGAVFPEAMCIGTGNPLREDMAFPKCTRDYVRSRLGASSTERLVLAPGDKFAAGNMTTWTVVMEALSLLANRQGANQYRLLLSRHPGDRTDQSLYDELIKWSPVPVEMVGREVLTASDMIPGIDLVVDFGGSIGIEAAYNRIPVISLQTEVQLEILKAKNGNRDLELVECVAAKVVGVNASLLASAIYELLTEAAFKPMRWSQEKFYPKPAKRGEAVRKIVDALESMIRSRA